MAFHGLESCQIRRRAPPPFLETPKEYVHLQILRLEVSSEGFLPEQPQAANSNLQD